MKMKAFLKKLFQDLGYLERDPVWHFVRNAEPGMKVCGISLSDRAWEKSEKAYANVEMSFYSAGTLRHFRFPVYTYTTSSFTIQIAMKEISPSCCPVFVSDKNFINAFRTESEIKAGQKDHKIPELLISLIRSCETLCVAGCCGLEAFDFCPSNIETWKQNHAKDELEEALKQLDEFQAEYGNAVGYASPHNELNHLFTGKDIAEFCEMLRSLIANKTT